MRRVLVYIRVIERQWRNVTQIFVLHARIVHVPHAWQRGPAAATAFLRGPIFAVLRSYRKAPSSQGGLLSASEREAVAGNSIPVRPYALKKHFGPHKQWRKEQAPGQARRASKL